MKKGHIPGAGNRHLPVVGHFFFNPLYMAPAKGFHFAPQFKVSSDLIISQDTEAINDSQGVACPLYDIIGRKILVLFMRNSKYHSFDAFQ